MPTTPSIEQTALTFYAAFAPGHAALLPEAVAPSWVDHTLPPGREPGLSGMVKALEQLVHLIPDLKTEIVKMLVAGDHVSVHVRFSGTHGGAFLGIAPTLKPIQFLAFDIHRIADQRIVESWHLEDNLGLLMQIGAIPALG